jgi:hypothetical protein
MFEGVVLSGIIAVVLQFESYFEVKKTQIFKGYIGWS